LDDYFVFLNELDDWVVASPWHKRSDFVYDFSIAPRDTPRNNQFSPSMGAQQSQIHRSIKSFRARVRHNYCAALRRSINRRWKLGEEVSRQIEFYGTTEEDCPCGETIHLTKMFSGWHGADHPVPCCH
jgi:hypothetical protein